MELPEILTQAEVAQWLKTSPASVCRMVKAGKIPHVVVATGRVKKTVRFVKGELVEWLARRSRGAGPGIRRIPVCNDVVTGRRNGVQVIETKGAIPVQQTGAGS